jgi:hypothetical protein
MTVPLSVTLAELRSPLEQAYRNSVYCSANLQQVGGTLGTRYCGNRWCLVCNRIRTARAMNRYLPVVDTWDDAQLVTLTLPNVPAAQLSDTIRTMTKTFQAIKLAIRRTDGFKVVALRKLECTYNGQRDDYHPHFHLVVQSQVVAQLLRQRWLDTCTTATPAAQDVRACDRNSLREVFKYFTKLMAKQRGKADAQGKSAPVDPRALDVIFTAMRRQRVYQPVGFTVAKDAPDENSENIEPVTATAAFTRPGEKILWTWAQACSDWVDSRTGECLTGYEPAVKFARFVEKLGAPVATGAREIRTIDDADARALMASLLEQSQRRLRKYAQARAEAGWKTAAEFDPATF